MQSSQRSKTRDAGIRGYSQRGASAAFHLPGLAEVHTGMSLHWLIAIYKRRYWRPGLQFRAAISILDGSVPDLLLALLVNCCDPCRRTRTV